MVIHIFFYKWPITWHSRLCRPSSHPGYYNPFQSWRVKHNWYPFQERWIWCYIRMDTLWNSVHLNRLIEEVRQFRCLTWWKPSSILGKRKVWVLIEQAWELDNITVPMINCLSIWTCCCKRNKLSIAEECNQIIYINFSPLTKLGMEKLKSL